MWSVAVGAVFIGCLWGQHVLTSRRGVVRASGIGEPALGEPALGDDWWTVRFRGAPVGMVRAQLSRLSTGYRLESHSRLRLLSAHNQAPLDLLMTADLAEDLTLKGFAYTLDAGAGVQRGRGALVGEEMRVHLSEADSARRIIKLARPPILLGALGSILERAGLVAGAEYEYLVFDPLTLSAQPLYVVVRGPERFRGVLAVRVQTTLAGAVNDLWLSPRGEVLGQTLGLGLTAVRATETGARWALARARRVPDDGADFFGATKIEVPAMPRRLARVQTIALRLSGAELEGFNLAGGRQRWGDGVVRITTEGAQVGRRRPVTDAPLGSLAADAFIQSDHPRIRALAQEAIGDAQDTQTAARRLRRWVHQRLRRQLVPGVPSALQTLEAGVGDCNEHSALFAALARSVGVPTRIVTGLVYQDGHFGYHAWNEVMVVGGWQTVDSTWDQQPVDAGHLRLLWGGTARQSALLSLMGRLKIEVISVNGHSVSR